MKSTRFIALAAFISCGLPRHVGAATLRIPQDHATIQACIDAAVDSQDQCVVAPGTYPETINFHGKGVTVRSAEGPEVTVIDATGISGSVVTCVNQEGPATVLEGFTITGGTGTLFAGDLSGGGMLNWNSDPTVIRCYFRDNTAEVGGGMYNYVYASPTLIGCTFADNTARVGGGLYNLQASPRLIGCSFVENSAAPAGGGAVANQFNSSPSFTNCDFRRNTAYLGGGLYSDWDSNSVLADCTFQENTAHNGGAIYSSLNSRPAVTRVAFVANTADSNGGGVYFEDADDTLLTDCRFVQNRASGNGGGLFNARGFFGKQKLARCSFVGNAAGAGGGMYTDRYNRVHLSECTFDQNAATIGGGMFNGTDAESTLTDCTFTENQASQGGGIHSLGQRLRLTRCRFEANTAAKAGGGLHSPFDPIGDSFARDTWIDQSSFVGNRAGIGGGLSNEGGRLYVDECNFERNFAIDGGGIHTFGPVNEFNRSTFNENSAQNAGGAAYNVYGEWVVSECSFTGNAAEIGGGLCNNAFVQSTLTHCEFERNQAGNGGAMANDSEVTLLASHCTFRGNHASDGGGAMFNLSDSQIAIRGCLFSANSTGGYGGAVLNFAMGLTVDCCSFSANEAELGGGALCNHVKAGATLSNSILWGNVPNELFHEESATSAIRFSAVTGGLPDGIVDGGGNVDADPLFVRFPDPGPDGLWDGLDDDFGDLRLRPASPCINAGDPHLTPSEGETDLDDHARVLCGRVDMGAFEFGLGDYTCDHSVNLADFASWPLCITGPGATPYDPGCESFDSGFDGAVDLRDFAAFLCSFQR